MSVILTSIIVLGIIGIVGAAVLYVVAQKFHVHEDPRIDQVEALLPGANCGGCGRSGCRDFAVACVSAAVSEPAPAQAHRGPGRYPTMIVPDRKSVV